MKVKEFRNIPVTDEQRVKGLTHVIAGKAVDCALRGIKLSRAALDSQLWQTVKKAGMPGLFAKVRKTDLYQGVVRILL